MSKDKGNSQPDGKGQTADDKAMERFAELMIDRLHDIQQDWKKPWFSESACIIPRNLNGRKYNGMNSVMLMLHCEKSGYKLPVFCTFDRIASLNHVKDRKGSRQKSKDGEGDKQQRVSILKGEKSFPVYLTTFTVVDKETKERISYDDYKLLSEEERKKYNVYPKLQVYNVFNVDQTNLQEARPELYAKLEEQCSIKRKTEEVKGEAMPAVDAMIKENGWYCPIHEIYGDHAYYSISRDEIILPERNQFEDIESFQSTLFHEAAHSTGSENRLDRFKPTTFGSSEYAAEELKAELTAAFVAANYGMVKCLKSDSLPYLKSWLDSLHESPEFLKTILLDVKRASNMLTQRIDGIKMRIDQGLPAVAEEWKAEQKPSDGMASSREIVAARTYPAPPDEIITDEEMKKRIEKFVDKMYRTACLNYGVTVDGFVENDGESALRLTVDSEHDHCYYIVTHEMDEAKKDHFILRLIDHEMDVLAPREMPQGREDAKNFMRDAVRSFAHYQSEKVESEEREQNMSFRWRR